MQPLTIAVAVDPETASAAFPWVRGLVALPGVSVRISPACEPALLAFLLGEPLLFEADESGVRSEEHPGGSQWLLDVDLLLLPAADASLRSLVASAQERGVLVAAPRTVEAEALVGAGGIFLEPGATAEELARLVRGLAEEEREAGIRRGRAQARRLQRMALSSHVAAAPLGVGEPGPERPGVTVIIPTRGGRRLRRCIQAVRRAAGDLPVQVVLVVTGGPEGMLPPCDEVVRCEPPFCWARANNAGLRLAGHSYVLLLNDDCYFLRAGDLERMVSQLERCGHLIALAPTGTGFPAHWEQTTLPRGVGLKETRFTLCGACVLFRREAIWTVGGFDERFDTYGCDEMDWFYRARDEGYRWAIDTEVSVEHEWSATYGSRREEELPRSMQLFRDLHGVEGVDGPHWDPPLCSVSWVIASRNNAGHLGRSLGSIAAQRHLYPADMEVVLALDCPSDPSVQVARSFNESLPEPLPLRIRVFPEAAGTPGRAKNRALRLARGAVHLPLDDDDAALPARAGLLPLLEGGADVAVGNFWVVGLDGSVVEKRVGPIAAEHLLQPRAQNWGLWAAAVRRETWARYGMNSETLASTEDLELWLRWLRDGVRFRHLDVPVHLYLLRPGSIIFQHNTMQVEDTIREAFLAGNGTPPMGLNALA